MPLFRLETEGIHKSSHRILFWAKADNFRHSLANSLASAPTGLCHVNLGRHILRAPSGFQ